MRPILSVTVLAYQHAPYIAKALDSILGQDFDRPFEVIVHDDASTDGTSDIIRDYASRYPKVIKPILQTKNQYRLERGRVTRIVYGAATGKYIAQCEGDDFWTDPRKLAKQVALLEGDENCMGSYHDTAVLMMDGTPTGRLMRAQLPAQMRLEDTMAPLAPFHSSSFVFRSAPLLKALPRWIRHVPSMDMLLFSLMVGNGYYAKAEGIMSAYRKHPAGITNTHLHKGTGLNLGRIKLWVLVDRHFGYRHTRRVEELFRHHWAHIVQQATPRARLRDLAELFQLLPTWFLRHPAFTLGRLRDVVRR